MKYIAYAALMIADILVILFFILFEQYALQVLLLHAFLIFVSWRIYVTFASEVEVLPYFILFFMPILGMIIFFTLYGSLHYFVRDGNAINDYEQMLSVKLARRKRKRIDYDSEIQTMSYFDMFSFIDPERKKEILINSQYAYKINNAKILAKGLESEDKEVQHYAATLLNSQENQFTNTISILRDAYEIQKTEANLDALIIAYHDYIRSSFIGKESIQIFKKEYVDLLLQKVHRETYDLKSLQSLFVSFIEINDFYNATLLHHKIEEEFGKSSQSIVNKLHILYKKGYTSQLVDALLTIEPEQCTDEPKLKELHDFFVKEVQ
ncbi:MAG: hypothetical protein JEY71_03475 [Sphaerochaeta sp.]|nr:hypothetical protein [Sphaerochaeta sp.]